MKPFFRWNNLKFPTFKPYSVSEKMLYHQRYSTAFQKLSFCTKTWKIGIRPENFMGAGILVLQWQGENHCKREMLNFPIPSFTLFQIIYHQSYSTDFQKLSFCWKMWKIGIRVENVMSAAILVCKCNVNTFLRWKNLKFPTFKLCTVSEKKLYHQNIQTIFKNFPSAERCG